MTPLTAALNAATHDAALQRQIADLTLLAVRGFNPARTGNQAFECRETALALVAALDKVIEVSAVEASPNIYPMKRRSDANAAVIDSAVSCAEANPQAPEATASVTVFEARS